MPYPTDQVFRWCSPSRPIAVTLIDRTSSPWWHEALVRAAADWSLSPIFDITVIRGASLTGVGAPYVDTFCGGMDGFVIVVCNYYVAPGGDYGNSGNESGFGPNGTILAPTILLNDWWGSYWTTDPFIHISDAYTLYYISGNVVCHEMGHALGEWHWPYQPVRADGTLGNSCMYQALGPQDGLQSLTTLYP